MPLSTAPTSGMFNCASFSLAVCTFGEEKPVCAKCQVHCYGKAMREKVRDVMRYAGPRMAWRHPWLALMHVVDKRYVALPKPSAAARANAAGRPAATAGTSTTRIAAGADSSPPSGAPASSTAEVSGPG